jgi:hypothetical protein|tara:strand:+ start:2978 stop:3469 length:492 start_codon:yes stop_codon:yes gene_type:complete
MARKLSDITRDLVLATNEYEIFNDDDLQAKIDELVAERSKKEDGIYFFYQDIDAEIVLFKKQIEKATKYVKFMKRQQENLKQYTIDMYSNTGELPKHSALNPIKVSESGGSVEVLDESLIPAVYWYEKTETVLRKKVILEDLKSGKEIPGVKLNKKQYVRGIK